MAETPHPKPHPPTSNAAAGISITRIVAALRKRVFVAWTEPAQFAKWFGTLDSEIPVSSVSMDVRPGGLWRATMFAGPERNEIHWSGAYREVIEPERLVFTLSDQAGADHEIVTVTFAAQGDTTEMSFRQVGQHLTVEQYAGARDGWLAFFDCLDELVKAA